MRASPAGRARARRPSTTEDPFDRGAAIHRCRGDAAARRRISTPPAALPAPESDDAVARMVAACVAAGCAVQVGGGIRDVEAATRWIDAGASLVILGSVAARDPGARRRHLRRAWEDACSSGSTFATASLECRAGPRTARAATELLRALARLAVPPVSCTRTPRATGCSPAPTSTGCGRVRSCTPGR